MDPSDDLLLRLVTDEDIERVREWMTPAERAVSLALRAGVDLKPTQVARTFGITRYAAARLIARWKPSQ
jgi:hypothetical protein